MKALVVGGGSIGGRHLRNLNQLGVESLGLVEPDASRREALVAEIPVSAFARLQDGLAWGPRLVLIATPSHLHIEPALQAARSGAALFVEKPLSHTPAGITELSEIVRSQGLISLVGCNMRFHPGPAKVTELLQDAVLGRILFARIQAGSYLPEWRPNSDYRSNYATQSKTGGGCILDCIHEIDLAQWYLGPIQSVFCWAGKVSSLEIETEDVAALICQHAGGAISEIHLDYVQRTYERGCQIVGELGSIFWDFNAKQVRWYDATNKNWTAYTQPESWTPNLMFVDEMKHFLDCMEKKNPTALPIPEAASLMQVVFAAKKSSQLGNMINFADAGSGKNRRP